MGRIIDLRNTPMDMELNVKGELSVGDVIQFSWGDVTIRHLPPSVAKPKVEPKVEQIYRGQSYKWPAFKVIQTRFNTLKKVSLSIKKEGNMTEIDVGEEGTGDWFGYRVDFDGNITPVSKYAINPDRALVLDATASTGSWSGGGNWRGYIFLKEGASVLFSVKGYKKWLEVINGELVEYKEVHPRQPQETL